MRLGGPGVSAQIGVSEGGGALLRYGIVRGGVLK